VRWSGGFGVSVFGIAGTAYAGVTALMGLAALGIAIPACRKMLG
jgi:hypothetical protein